MAYGCSGGRKEQRCQCFGLRPMWRYVLPHRRFGGCGLIRTMNRSNGVGELYTYLPLTEHNAAQQRKIPPQSIENSDYGFSVGRGSFDFRGALGNWITIATRVKLNDIGFENGEVEVWVDGKSVIFIDGLTLRQTEDGTIRGMQFQTFFGGPSNASIFANNMSSGHQATLQNGRPPRTRELGSQMSLAQLSPNVVLWLHLGISSRVGMFTCCVLGNYSHVVSYPVSYPRCPSR